LLWLAPLYSPNTLIVHFISELDGDSWIGIQWLFLESGLDCVDAQELQGLLGARYVVTKHCWW
jgi:hypothetical protein